MEFRGIPWRFFTRALVAPKENSLKRIYRSEFLQSSFIFAIYSLKEVYRKIMSEIHFVRKLDMRILRRLALKTLTTSLNNLNACDQPLVLLSWPLIHFWPIIGNDIFFERINRWVQPTSEICFQHEKKNFISSRAI